MAPKDGPSLAMVVVTEEVVCADKFAQTNSDATRGRVFLVSFRQIMRRSFDVWGGQFTTFEGSLATTEATYL
jgi:hypothetical protein